MKMDTQREDEHDDSELLLTDEIPGDDEDGNEAEAPKGEEGQAQPAEQEDDPLELAIEGEDDGNETELVKRLRDQVRSAHGEIATLKRATAPAKVEVGKKPDLWEDCDGDPEKFEAAITGWHERKRQVESQENETRSKTEAQQREFDRLQSRHNARGAALRIPDFETKNQLVIDTLGPEIAGLALVAADDSAKLVGALGSNPMALQKIADEPNPILKLKMLLKLESRITVKKKPPAPEAPTIQRGSAPLARVDSDKKLAKLEADAAKTGRRDAVIAYKRELKKAKAA